MALRHLGSLGVAIHSLVYSDWTLDAAIDDVNDANGLLDELIASGHGVTEREDVAKQIVEAVVSSREQV